MARTIQAEVDIAAEPERVWQVLTDFATYEQWNPYIVSAVGTASEGEPLTLGMTIADKTFEVRPTIVEAEEPRRLRWIGHLGVRGLFDADHQHHLEVIPGGTRYIQSEHFSGALVPLLGKTIAATSAAFAAMNQALKARVEHRREEGLAGQHAASNRPRGQRGTAGGQGTT